MGRRIPGLTLLAAMALMLAPTAPHAQEPLQVQPPAPQSQPSFRPRPAPTARPPLPPSNQLQEIPSVIPPTPQPPAPAPQMPPPQLPPPAPLPPPPPPPPPPPASMLRTQPILPAIFRGCWDGRIELLDSIERMPGAPRVGVWTPKTYRICYQRIGSGPFELTFSQVGVDPNLKIVNPTGRMDLISTDGRNAARMRAQLHFDEFYLHRRGQTFAVDEETILDCTIQSGGAMLVRGQVFGRRDGGPWFRASWHAVFSRVGNLPE